MSSPSIVSPSLSGWISIIWLVSQDCHEFASRYPWVNVMTFSLKNIEKNVGNNAITFSGKVLSTLHRDWSPKFATGLNMIIGCSSKSIWVIKLSFCQNDPLMVESFWQNNSLVTHILSELQSFIILSPVANFGDQSLHRA